MKKYFVTLMMVLISVTLMAQKSSNEVVIIQTNGVCEKCKDLFTEKVPYFKGVTNFSYDMKTAKMTVTYNPKKTTPAEIRTEVSKLGYNADDVKADQAARAKLPECCRSSQPHGCSKSCSHGNSGGCGGHKH